MPPDQGSQAGSWADAAGVRKTVKDRPGGHLTSMHAPASDTVAGAGGPSSRGSGRHLWGRQGARLFGAGRHCLGGIRTLLPLRTAPPCHPRRSEAEIGDGPAPFSATPGQPAGLSRAKGGLRTVCVSGHRRSDVYPSPGSALRAVREESGGVGACRPGSSLRCGRDDKMGHEVNTGSAPGRAKILPLRPM